MAITAIRLMAQIDGDNSGLVKTVAQSQQLMSDMAATTAKTAAVAEQTIPAAWAVAGAGIEASATAAMATFSGVTNTSILSAKTSVSGYNAFVSTEVPVAWQMAAAGVDAAAASIVSAIEAMSATIVEALETDSAATEEFAATAKLSIAEAFSGVKTVVADGISAIAGFRNTIASAAQEMRGLGTEASIALTAPIALVAKMGIEYNDLERRTERAFETMVGGKQKAEDLFHSIEKFATFTPFKTENIVQFSQRLLATKAVTDTQLLPSLKAMGDYLTHMGKGDQDMSRVVNAFSQVSAMGKITRMELNRLSIDAGIPGLQILAEGAHKTTAEMSEMIKKGVDAHWAIQTLLQGMEKQAPDAMKKNQDTLQGVGNAFYDLYQRISGIVTKATIFEPLIKGMQQVNTFMQEVETTSKTWSQAFKTNILANLGGLAAIGPTMLLLSGLGKAFTTLLTPMGLFGAGIGLVVRYLIQHQDEAKKLVDIIQNSFKGAFGDGAGAVKLLDDAGGLLVKALELIIPPLATVIGWISQLVTWFGNLPTPVKDTIAVLGTVTGLFIKLWPVIQSVWTWGGALVTAFGTLSNVITATLVPRLAILDLALKGLVSTLGVVAMAAAAAFAGWAIGTEINQHFIGSLDDQAAATDKATAAMMEHHQATQKLIDLQHQLQSVQAQQAAAHRGDDGGMTQKYINGLQARAEALKKQIADQTAIAMHQAALDKMTPEQRAKYEPKSRYDADNPLANPGPVKTVNGGNEAANAAKKLETAYQAQVRQMGEAIAGLKEEQAERGKATAYAKEYYLVTEGALKGLGSAQKAHLLSLASEKDRLQGLVDEGKKYGALLDKFKEQLQASKDQLDEGANASKHDKMNDQLERQINAIKGITAAQKEQLEGIKDEIVSNQEAYEIAKKIDDIDKDRKLRAASKGDPMMAQFMTALGGPEDAKDMADNHAKEYSDAYGKFKANLQGDLTEKTGDQITELQDKITNFGKAGYAAAVQAYGGLKMLESLKLHGIVTDDDVKRLASYIDYERIYSGMLGQRQSLQQAVVAAQRDFTTETMKANDQFSVLLDPSKVTLSDDQRKAIEKLKTEVLGLTKALDGANASKWEKDQSKSMNDAIQKLQSQLNGGSRFSVGSTQAQSAFNNWLQQNEQAIAKLRTEQGDALTDKFISDMHFDFIKQADLERIAQAKQKIDELTQTLAADGEKAKASSPFEAWLVQFEEFDKATRSWQLPPGMSRDQMQQIYDQQQRMAQIAEVAQTMSQVGTTALMSAFTPDQSAVNRFNQVNQQIMQLKQNLARDPRNEGILLQIQQLQQQSDKLGKQINNSLGSVFDRLFVRIYQGFQQMLVKMATAYIQSQLQQQLSKLLTGAFGGTGAVGGSTGGVLGSFGSVLGGSAGSLNSIMGPGTAGSLGSLDGVAAPTPGLSFAAHGTDYLPAGAEVIAGENGPERIRAARPLQIVPHYKGGEDDDSDGGSLHIHNHYHLPNVKNVDEFRSAASVVASRTIKQADRQYKRTK